MRCLIVGTGSIGRRHVGNLGRLTDNCEFVFLRRGGYEDEFSKSVSALVESDIAKAIEAGLDCAVIATPTCEHASTIEALLHARVPFYIEKPVVATENQLQSVRGLLSRLSKIPTTMVGCNLRFLPSLQRLRELIVNGEIGAVTRANLQAGQWLPDWRPGTDYRESYSADPEMGGGVILDLVHEFDVARWILGEFASVKAMAGKLSSLDIMSEDTACILLSGADKNIIASIGLDYISRVPVRRYEFTGEQGSIVWDLFQKELLLLKPEGTTRIDCGESGYDVALTYENAMKEFLNCLNTGVDTSQSIWEGIESVQLAISARQAAGL